MQASNGRMEAVLVIGAPLCLAAVECFHPHVMDLLHLPIERWLGVHHGLDIARSPGPPRGVTQSWRT